MTCASPERLRRLVWTELNLQAAYSIQQISDIELVIDLRVARAMGMRISQDLLLRANDVIL